VPSRHPAGGEVIWRELLPRSALLPDSRRIFEDELAHVPDVAYVRFNIFPDGGVARLRLFGRPFDKAQG
jgi:allantoicase